MGIKGEESLTNGNQGEESWANGNQERLIGVFWSYGNQICAQLDQW